VDKQARVCRLQLTGHPGETLELELVAAAAAGAQAVGVRVGVHVKFDSGMGRLGIKDPAEAR